MGGGEVGVIINDNKRGYLYYFYAMPLALILSMGYADEYKRHATILKSLLVIHLNPLEMMKD